MTADQDDTLWEQFVPPGFAATTSLSPAAQPGVYGESLASVGWVANLQGQTPIVSTPQSAA